MSYKFTAAEQAQIQQAIDACTGLKRLLDGTVDKNNTAGTNAIPLYQTLSTIISQKLQNPSGLDSATISDLKSAKLWLDVAIGANGGTGMHSEFIRTYTNIQGQLRLGKTFTEDEMQAASNAVARNVANGLIKGDSNADLAPWTVPRINQIAGLDASAIGEVLFKDKLGSNNDTAITQNAAWSGTLGFNLLGGKVPFESWRLMTAGDPGSELAGNHQLAKPNTLDDFKNVMFAMYAYDKAFKAGVVAGGIDFFKALAEGAVMVASEGTSSASTPASDALAAQWSVSFSSGSLGAVRDVTERSPVLGSIVNRLSNTGLNECLDMLRRSVYGNAISKTLGDNDFKANALTFFNQMGDAQQYGLTLTGGGLVQQAKTDFTAMVALNALSMFRFTGSAAIERLQNSNYDLYLKWQQDQLDAKAKENGTQNYSDEWREDRAAMLSWIIKHNVEKDQKTTMDGPDDVLFRDLSTNAEIRLQSSFLPVGDLDRRRFLFGTDAADTLMGGTRSDRLYGGDGGDIVNGQDSNDHLEGNAGDDSLTGGSGWDELLGGAGDDTLNGGTGSDELKGGGGTDTYQFSTGDGADTVIDSDGQGKIVIDGITLATGKASAADNKTWKSNENQNIQFTLIDSHGSNPSLRITYGNGDSVLLKNYTQGAFGITLQDYVPVAMTDPVATTTITGKHVSSGDDPSKYVVSFQGDDGNDLIQGEDGVRNFATTGNGDSSIVGGSGNDIIKSGNGNNLIAGDDGQDIIIARDGKNRIYAGQVEDIKDAMTKGANATASGEKGSFINVGDGDNTIVGGLGNDDIILGSGNNLVIAGPGDTTVSAGMRLSLSAGGVGVADDWTAKLESLGVIEGALEPVYSISGKGYEIETAGYTADETYHGNYMGQQPVGMGSDTIFGGRGNDAFLLANGNNYADGGAGDDVILGSNGDDTLFGGDGNDVLYGGGGTNFIDGEDGDNFIVGKGGNNTIYVGKGNSTIYVGEYVDWATSSKNSSNYVEGGTGDTTIFGSGGNDTLVAGTGNDVIRAGDGNATIIGGDGSDKIWGGAGNDIIYVGDGGTPDAPNQIVAGSGSTTIYGGDGVDHIFGGSGTNVIYAGDGDTEILAGSGSTTIYGGDGIDNIFGGSGTNVIYAGDGGVSGAPTTVNAGDGPTTVYGGDGIDILRGGAGTSILYAGDGGTEEAPTQVFGGSGNSTLVAGAGNDILVSGSGPTTYVVDSESGNIIILHAKAADVLQFGEGISPADLGITSQLYSDGSNALLLDAGGASVTIMDGVAAGVRQFKFSDGSSMSLQELLQQASVIPLAIVGSNYDFLFSATPGETLIGTTGNDTIFGFGANDTLVAGNGLATLFGGGGYTTYVVNSTASHTIVNQSTTTDTLKFGPSISAADLKATFTQGADGSTVTILHIKEQGSVILNGNAAGVLNQVAFDDGSTMSVNQLLAQSSADTTVSVNDDGSYVATFVDGQGNQTVTTFSKTGVKLSDTWSKVDGSHGTDTFHNDGSSFGSTIHANGTSQTYTDDGHGTRETKDYSADSVLTESVLTTSQQDMSMTTHFDANGTKLNDTWTKSDGSSGTDVFHADGSSSGTVSYVNGTTSSYTDDGQGNRTETLFNAMGAKTSDSWKHQDGSHGTDIFNGDGSSSGTEHHPDGTYSTYQDDGHGSIVTDTFDATGKQIDETVTLADGASRTVKTDDNGKTTATIYDVKNTKVSDSWIGADGSHGSDTFNADGSSTGISYKADGSYATTENDGLGQTITKYYTWKGSLLGSSVVEAHGAGNVIATYLDAAGAKVNEFWKHADGTSGTDLIGPDDFNGMSNLVPKYSSNASKYGNTNWTAFDGTSGGFSNTTEEHGWKFIQNYFVMAAASESYGVINGGISLTNKPGGSFDSAQSSLYLPDNSFVQTLWNKDPYSAIAIDGTPLSVSAYYDFHDWTTGVEIFGTLDTDGSKILDGGALGDNGWSWTPTMKASSVKVPMTKTVQGNNGMYSTFKDDGQGNAIMISYDGSNHKIQDLWLHNDGTSGVDIFNPDGSISGASMNADGTESSYTRDAKGQITVAENYPFAKMGLQTVNKVSETVSLPPQTGQFPGSGFSWVNVDITIAVSGDQVTFSYHPNGTVDFIYATLQGKVISEGYVQTDPGYGAAVTVNGTKYGWIYDVAGVPTAKYIDDGQGHRTTYFINAGGKIANHEVSTTDSEGAITTDLYDVAGMLSGHSVKQTIGQGQWETTTYALDGTLTARTVEVSDGLGNSVTTNYHGDGKVMSSQEMIVNAAGELVATTYDSHGVTQSAFVSSTSSDGVIRTNTYDGNGHLTGSVLATTDSTGKVTTANYDASGALTSFITHATTPEGTTEITTYDAHGVMVQDNVLDATALQASTAYRSDGSAITVTSNPDRTYSILSDDRAGNVVITNYNEQNVRLNDTWTRGDGSHGTDTFNADGTFNGTATYADGTTSSYVNDGKGKLTTIHSAADGTTVLGSTVTTISSGAVLTTNFDASGHKISDNWAKSDGTAGSNDFLNSNHAPTISVSIDNQTIDETKPFSYVIPVTAFSDSDTGDSLSYTVQLSDGKDLPGWLTYNPATRTLSGTPGDADTGTLNLKVIATDTFGLSASTSFNLAVNNINEAPIAAVQIGNQSAIDGKTFSFVIPANTFSDPDAGDTLTYAVSLANGSALPTWLHFDANTHTLSGTPTTADIGSLALKVVAADANGLAALESFNLVVNHAPDMTLLGTTSNDALTGQSGNDVLQGLDGNDRLVGNAGNDTLDGGLGIDTMIGGTGNDTYIVNNVSDAIVENIGEGIDTITSSVNYVLPQNVEILILSGTGNLTATGNSGYGILVANSGNSTLAGGAGINVLEGGSGNDFLTGVSGQGVMLGGAGSDIIVGGSKAQFFAGGSGDDTISIGATNNVIAFNQGDGKDAIRTSPGASSTLSLGKGISYADLGFSKNKDDLVLTTGGGESITFKGWYASSANHSFAKLQVIEEASSTFDPHSPNMLYSKKVEEFDFAILVNQFDQARAAQANLTSWSLMNSLLDAHLSGSDTAAIGGDLAYYYGTKGNLTGLDLTAAVATEQNTQFAKLVQPISAWNEISQSGIGLL